MASIKFRIITGIIVLLVLLVLAMVSSTPTTTPSENIELSQ